MHQVSEPAFAPGETTDAATQALLAWTSARSSRPAYPAGRGENCAYRT
jgi:hypothetical protein